MHTRLTIPERLKDLRVAEKRMSLQELSDYVNIQISQYPICISMMMRSKYWLMKNIIHGYYQNYCLINTSINS